MTNKLSHIFECSDHITEKQYRTSRALFILDGCASTQIFTVTSGCTGRQTVSPDRLTEALRKSLSENCLQPMAVSLCQHSDFLLFPLNALIIFLLVS